MPQKTSESDLLNMRLELMPHLHAPKKQGKWLHKRTPIFKFMWENVEGLHFGFIFLTIILQDIPLINFVVNPLETGQTL